MDIHSHFSSSAGATAVDETVRAKTTPPGIRFGMKREIQSILQTVLNGYLCEAQGLSVGHLQIRVTNFWNQRGAIRIELSKEPSSDQSWLQINKSIGTFLKAYAKAFDADSPFDPNNDSDRAISFTDTPENIVFALTRMSEKYYPGLMKKCEQPLERVKRLAAQLQTQPGMRLQ